MVTAFESAFKVITCWSCLFYRASRFLQLFPLQRCEVCQNLSAGAWLGFALKVTHSGCPPLSLVMPSQSSLQIPLPSTRRGSHPCSVCSNALGDLIHDTPGFQYVLFAADARGCVLVQASPGRHLKPVCLLMSPRFPHLLLCR